MSIGLTSLVLGFTSFLLISTSAWAEPERGSSHRFALSAGAGTGTQIAQERVTPFRLDLGAELFLKNYRHMGLGYRAAFIGSSDTVNSAAGPTSLFRMAHFFPHLRCFVIGDFLSLQAAPGLAVSHRGGMMMGSGTANAGSVVGFATHLGIEAHIPLENQLSLGLEAGYDYIAASKGADPLPRSNVYTINANLRFALGSWE